MEQLQVHSRSYIVRWIRVRAGESISWSLQPHKKGLNFGIFKHPGGVAGASPNLPGSATLDTPPTPSENGTQRGRRNSKATEKENPTANVVDRLQSIGLKCVSWFGKCEADQVSMGTFDVHDGEDGMYGLVFDNTFSKTVSKTATFVLMTHATNAPPKSGAQLRYSNSQAATSSSTLARSPTLVPTTDSSDSLPHEVQAPHGPIPVLKVARRSSALSLSGSFYTGIMHKKRRKKNQGYARRFFSLDFTSATLSYYRNGHASALRGSIPLALAAIGVDTERKEFSIDSGAEVWHLRLRNKKDFDNWQRAFERATIVKLPTPSPVQGGRDFADVPFSIKSDPHAEREWRRVEELVGRVSGTRDAVRRLAQDTDPKYTQTSGSNNNAMHSPGLSPVDGNPFFNDLSEREPQKLPFWKRKPSTGSQGGSPASLLRRSVSAQSSVPLSSLSDQAQSTPIAIPRIKTPTLRASATEEVHERCMALLRDLDATVADFSSLLAECKLRRHPPVSHSASRLSLDSNRSEDFYDAEESVDGPAKLLSIRRSNEDGADHDDFYSDEESVTSSDAGDDLGLSLPSKVDAANLFPTLPKNLTPTEVPSVTLRGTVAPPHQPPPSVIGILRKNAGKDLSLVAVPVTANEPTSMLQRLAEPLEDAHLLSAAAALVGDEHEMDRLVHVAAFAIASFSSNRVKERAARKPFNPMLGETYELIRHERNEKDQPAYRFVAEKVTHHPVGMAWQANSLSGSWSIAQSMRPVQKFWGKSIELNTEGKMRLSLHKVSGVSSPPADESQPKLASEHYTWTQPTTYLRNVIAGEKYVEPTGSMTIANEVTGAKAVATFKASGLFSGRSEDVNIAFYAPNSSSPLGYHLTGKWTTALTRSDTNAEIWRAGPLVQDASKVWGFPVFSAQLNEITPIEEKKMAPTDSRLRPDQRAFEAGELDRAEALKAKLEERQRSRRKVLENHGGTYEPRFFQKIEVEGGSEEEVWQLKIGKEGYWECRERGDWKGSPEIFDA